ncbi:hypothetical protein BKA57DRAFT_501273 [Linnemannia elongata]|nr:hypothetical protein BKA57DRAFT_501273 [Linnemannia elongata]
MTGQHQHPQQYRITKPSTGGFQLLPLNGGDVDMLHGDSGDKGTQEFAIKDSEYNAGRAVKDPVNSLLYDLT